MSFRKLEVKKGRFVRESALTGGPGVLPSPICATIMKTKIKRCKQQFFIEVKSILIAVSVKTEVNALISGTAIQS